MGRELIRKPSPSTRDQSAWADFFGVGVARACPRDSGSKLAALRSGMHALPMRVRNLTEADHDVWKRMRGELWPDCPAARQELELRMIVQKGDAYGVLLLESDDGRVGGFAEVSVRHGVDGAAYEDVGYLEGWYVEKDLRRRGGGRALVAAAELWARTRGLHEFGSDTGVDDEGAISAHRALGFREHDRIVQFLKPLDPG